MRSATRRTALAAASIGAVLLLAACDSNSGSSAAGSNSGPTTASSAPSATASTDPGAGTADSSAPTPASAPTQDSPAPAAPLPVLGTVWATGVQGYGVARPSGLNNGGDPTGIVTGLTWSSWGGTHANGTGSAEYVGPGQSVAQGSEQQAKIVAFDLGTCNGKPAYRAIEWYFPSQGQHFDPNHYFDACTGQDHGM